MSNPLAGMIDSHVKCIRCKRGMRECLAAKDCLEECSCGYFTKVGEPCRNQGTSRCSTKVKYGKYNRRTKRYE